MKKFKSTKWKDKKRTVTMIMKKFKSTKWKDKKRTVTMINMGRDDETCDD